MTDTESVYRSSRYEGIVAAALVRARCIQVSAQNRFAYAAGGMGPVFCDMNLLGSCRPSSPNSDKSPWDVVAGALPLAFREACALYGEVDALAGVVLGGVVPTVAIGTQLNIPWFLIRTNPGDRNKNIEGGSVRGLRVAVIEDVVRTGTTGSLKAVEILLGAGASVPFVLCVVDYCLRKTHELFTVREMNLFRLTSLPSALFQMQRAFQADDVRVVTDGQATPATMAVIRGWYIKQGGLSVYNF